MPQFTQYEDLNSLVKRTLQLNGISTHFVVNCEIFKRVVAIYDWDHDTRVLEFIDYLDPYHLSQLIIAHEVDGCIALYWKSEEIVGSFREGGDVLVHYANGAIDYWHIYESRRIIDFYNLKDKLITQIALN